MQCICRLDAGQVAGWQGGDSSAVLTVCDLGHASTSRRVQQQQPSTGQQEVSSICRIMYILTT